MRIEATLWALTLLATTCCQAAPLRVTATGDSQTVNYTTKDGGLLKSSFLLSTVASSGANSYTYTGKAPDYALSPPVAHDFAAETLATDPDVIVFMLGVNDAMNNVVAAFETHIAGVFQQFSLAVNSRGAHPQVIVATNIPVLPKAGDPKYAAANTRLESELNPWLASQAQQHGFYLLDLNAQIQQVAGWQGFYSDDGINPGNVHLWGGVSGGKTPGYQWISSQVAEAIQALAVPEPGALLLCAQGLLACGIVCRWRIRSGGAGRR